MKEHNYSTGKGTCEFCLTSYDESRNNTCYKCQCGREGRTQPGSITLREDIEERGRELKSVGLTKRVH